jgi:uncharacterized membrane protein
MLRKPAIVIFALGLLYIAVRLWRVTDTCLWFDEIFSVHAAEHPWNSLFWFVAQDIIHPPLFYVLLKIWIGLGGESVFWLRLLPVAFSVLAIFPFVRLCTELKLKTPVILLSLGLLAVNGALIKYTQTLRMYSMLMCLALVSMWLFARYFNRGKSFVPLVIANVVLVYTHYFGWLVIGSEVAALLIFQRIKWRRAVVMFAVVVASFAPWLVAVWRAARQGSDVAQNIGWQALPNLGELLTFATDLVEPFYFQASNAEPASIYLVSVPLLVVFSAAMIEYLIKWVRKAEPGPGAVLAIFVVVPLIVAFAASWLLPHSVWGTRHLIVVFPPMMILFASAVLSFHLRPVRIGAVALIVVIVTFAFVRDAGREMPRHVWCAWNDVAEDIKAKESAGVRPATIYAFEDLVAYHLWFALRHSEGFHIAVVKGINVRTADEAYFLPRGFQDVRNTRLEDVAENEMWLAFRTSRHGEYAPLVENFTKRGYEPCPADMVDYGSTTVFWIKMSKDGARCRDLVNPEHSSPKD